MKRSTASIQLLRTLALIVAGGSLSALAQTPVIRQGNNHTIAHYQSDAVTQRLDFTLDSYTLDTQVIDGQAYTILNIPPSVTLRKKGYADLPFYSASVQISANASINLVVESEEHEDIPIDYPMLPSKGMLYRNENPDLVPYSIDPESLRAEWYPEQLAEAAEPYFWRDVHGTNVYFYPFQYNAVTQTLRVTKHITLRIGETPDRRLADVTTTPVADMEPMYQSLFINYQPSPTRWAHELPELGDILVIYTPRDATAIQPYISWKREKGYKVKGVQVAVGTNVKTTIQQEYAANANLLYVQLVGDWADIKSDVGTSQSKPMDPMLGCVAGSDNYPDLIVGRFSGSSASLITTQVNKAINYEKNPDTSGTWYKNGLIISSNEGAGQGDDSESDAQHVSNIAKYRMKKTYTNIASVLGDDSKSSYISSTINNGVSLINYCGHGDTTLWGTCSYSNTQVNALTNASKLPIISSVACLNGNFTANCFAEAWLQKANGGAVAGMFATINQPWQPPMRGQDYFNDLLFGGYTYGGGNPGSGTSTTYGRTTVGSCQFNANVLMYAESSQTDDLDTIKTWTIFGDVTLQARTDTPKAITISNTTVTPGTPFTAQVKVNGVAFKGALVSLSQEDQPFSALTDANGNVSITHNLSSGTAKLVVTGPNTTTIYENVDLGGTPADFTIITQPASQTVAAGSSVSFTVGASGGSTPYSYQWYKNSTAVSEATSATYTFTAQASDNNASIYAVVSDSSSPEKTATSRTATLTVTDDGGGGSDITTYNEVEDNGSISAANAVPDAATKIVATIGSSSDKDFFKVLVGAGKTLTVRMTGPSGKDYDLYLYNGSGTQLKKSTGSTATENLSYQNVGTSAEYYFIYVMGYNGAYTTTTPYNLTVAR